MLAYVRLVLILLVILSDSFLLISEGGRNEFPVVRTNNGLLRGTKNYTLYENRPYYSFKGIPYAAPPLKELRFKPPQKSKSWKGIRNAFEFGNECIQPVEIINIFQEYFPSPYITGDEDCLFLNVYTSDMSGNLPVLVYIHGGFFSESTGSIYGPDFLVDHDVIVVTLNYRLGPFGFLSLGTQSYSGNMGIKDTVLALKWVNENIGNFGGDSNRITIAGHNSAAVFTHLLTVSKASQHLFQRSIMISGSLLNIWGVNERKDHVPEMFEFARRTDPSVRTMSDLIRFLQNVNATYLIESFVQKIKPLEALPRKLMPNFIWSPILEVPYDENEFLMETGPQIIKDKVYDTTIDTMFTYTSKEAIYFVPDEINNPALLKSFNRRNEVQLPLNYDSDIVYQSKTYKRIAEDIHDFYFGKGVLVDGNTMSEYIDLRSDMWIRYGVDLSARIQAEASSGRTYLLEFSIDDKLNLIKLLCNVTMPGTSIGDDVVHLFRFPLPDFYENAEHNRLARKAVSNISKVFANFVKYGNPSIKQQIKPITKYQMNYFNITNDGIIIGKNPRADAMALWDEIYSEHYKGFLRTNILNG